MTTQIPKNSAPIKKRINPVEIKTTTKKNKECIALEQTNIPKAADTDTLISNKKTNLMKV